VQDKRIIDAFAHCRAVSRGTVSYSELLPFMDEGAKERAAKLCSAPQGVIVAAFPYFAGSSKGNLSLYARGEDYHRVLLRELEEVSSKLRQSFKGFNFVPCVDSSPLPEREAALRAGLGIMGDNGLIFCPPYGSFVFLGCILTDLCLESVSNEHNECLHCGLCQKHCPTGALTKGRVDIKKCLSDITQRKGELTEEEIYIIKSEGTAWGCDVCQKVCPLNRDAKISPIREFTGCEAYPLIDNLCFEEINALGSREFMRRHSGRAFTWRGKAVLVRNLEILNGQKDD